jgi:hypothetical protein
VSERHTRTRRRNHARRPDWDLAPRRPEQPKHAAIPTYPSAAASMVVGTEDACLRCEGGIVLTLTGWEHA